jgi:hypothetical protein
MIERRLDQACMTVLADSCAVQNILSSPTLQASCERQGFHFVLTKYCLYECLDKPRKIQLAGDTEIRNRLIKARMLGFFPAHELSIEDLQEAAILRLRRRLGAGELSAIALAKRFGTGMQTDDDRAEKLAIEVLSLEKVQTTPHVVGWLLFHGHVQDHHIATIVEEHTAVGRNLTARLQHVHAEACRVRLLARVSQSGGGD